MTSWHAWQADDGSALFVSDGPKHPVLVMVRDGGQSEMVLANFTSTDHAATFQRWIDEAFTETGEANQRMAAHLHRMYQVDGSQATE